MAKGKGKGQKADKRERWHGKGQQIASDDDANPPEAMEDSDDDQLEGMLPKYGGSKGAKEPRGVFAFDSASEESDDEKMLEERLRQFERVQFKSTVASDVDDDEDEEEEFDEMADFSNRPTKNKYGGNVDDRFLEIIEDDGGEEPSAAVLEEQEAKVIQKRLASMITDNDVNLELLGLPVVSNANDDVQQEIGFEQIGKNAKPQQLLAMVDKKYPELEPLISRVKEEVKHLQSKWTPLVRLLEDKENAALREKVGRSALMFARSKHLVGFTYCMNAMFYLRMRAHHEVVDGHPVTARLVSNHKLLEQLASAENFFMKPGKRLDALLKAKERGASSSELIRIAEKQFASKASQASRRLMFGEMNEAAENLFENDDGTKLIDQPADEKRKLSDKMEKTGGIPRPKTKRNPRVANRNKFNKALKRRKASGVREWQPPVNAYGGEMTGIRAGLRRSIKLKM